MTHDPESQLFSNLDPKNPPRAERLRQMEEWSWQRLEDHRASRARMKRRLVVAGVSSAVVVGVAAGATAIKGTDWLTDFLIHVKLHLAKLHEIIFGSNR
jgi:hypothetical protein